MKRIFALLFSIALMLSLLPGCGLLAETELADPEPEAGQPEDAEAPPEPEGSKAVTLVFAYEQDELQNRFIGLAREAGEQAILIELADPARAAEAVEAAGEMAVVFVNTAPDSNSVLGKRAVFVGNPEGEGELYLRLTGRTAMRAADNLIRGVATDEETELKLSGHKISIPADGVLEP